MLANNFIISITSVPFRFKNELVQVLKSLSGNTLGIKIIVSIPKAYRKGWTYTQEDLLELSKIPEVVLNIIDKDYGPATKLLGGIEWVRNNGLDITGIITMDDDIIFQNPATQILSLVKLHLEQQENVITFQGLKLIHPPYYSGNGLHGVREDWCHGVAGFLGVLYPRHFFKSNVVFNLFEELDPNFYSEDDAYFGAVAARLDIKIWSSTNLSKWSSISKISAVDKMLEGKRQVRESKMYNDLVSAGFFKFL